MNATSKDNIQPKPLAGLQELREELIERHANDQHFYVRISTALDLAEERVRRADAEASARRLNIRTEQQVAKELDCSIDTIRRARKAHNVAHISAGNLIRYTDEQFLKLLEAMEKPTKLKEVRQQARRAS
jgi:hypothetical protein